MTLLWPWALLSLLPVAAAAFWALRRPMHQLLPVGSLRLWQRALEALGAAHARRSPRLSLAWALLLMGAAAGGAALSRPTYFSRAPARRIAVAVYPSAELAGLPDGVGGAVEALLRRLDPGDQVRLIFPSVLGGAGELLRRDEAVRQVREIGAALLPVPAEELSLPGQANDTRHLYRFAPATLALMNGPGITTIVLPARPGEVTLDAFAAAPVAETATVEILLALRNHSTFPRSGELLLRREDDLPVTLKYDLSPGQRTVLAPLPTLPAGESYSATILGSAGTGSGAFLARHSVAIKSIAMVGRDDPLVRRFVQTHKALRLVGDLAEADAVVAIGVAAPTDKPALVIDPPASPPGWQAVNELTALALRDADVLEDHPLLAHVNLAAVVVRRASAWQPIASPPEQRLITLGANALLLAAASPPRIYLAFDLAPENTNFAAGESVSFVIFMANVMEYLLPDARSGVSYESITPLQAGRRSDWTRLSAPSAAAQSPLPAPGLFRDAAGALHAISLVGLRSAEPKRDLAEQISAAPLPPPAPLAEGAELWPALLAAGALLWLTGWTLRLR